MGRVGGGSKIGDEEVGLRMDFFGIGDKALWNNCQRGGLFGEDGLLAILSLSQK